MAVSIVLIQGRCGIVAFSKGSNNSTA